MIITGAPVELMNFEKVDYWEELKNIMDYCNKKSKIYYIHMLGSTSSFILLLWYK